MGKEAKARIRINRLLQRAGWRFFDDEDCPANIALETNIKIKKKDIDQFGDDFEKTVDGFVDYLLLDSFLVDRIELENQAWKNLVRTLKNDYTCVIYKENRDDWRKAEIVVSTVQSLSFNNKYRSLFSPNTIALPPIPR